MTRDRVTRAGPLAVLGLLLLGLTSLGLVLQAREERNGFIILALVQGALYLAGVWWAGRSRATGSALVGILLVAFLARFMVLVAPPYLSTDIYRYVWDGRVQAAGINPYRFVPADAALTDLRDGEIYPNINRKDYAPTIYPPVAQAIFLAVERLSDSITAMRLAVAGFDLAAIALLLLLLRRAGLPLTRILVYAWNPLTVWEFAGSGHIDAACIAFLCLALLLHQAGRKGWTGAALGAAALVKPFPLSILPALYRPWDWRYPVGFLLTAALGYLPYLGVGTRVLGFLPGYVQEEGLASGSGFYPLVLLRHALGWQMPASLYVAASLLLLAALALRVVAAPSQDRSVRSATLLALSFVFLITPHYPSYLAWLLVLGVVEPSWPLLYATAASFALYLPIPLEITGSIVYGGLALIALAQRLRPPSRIAFIEAQDAASQTR